jgi:hypothetical protein
MPQACGSPPIAQSADATASAASRPGLVVMEPARVAGEELFSSRQRRKEEERDDGEQQADRADCLARAAARRHRHRKSRRANDADASASAHATYIAAYASDPARRLAGMAVW